jgi:hypothetical protein
VTASFFVGSPQHDAEAEVAVAEKVSTATEQPRLPVAADGPRRGGGQEEGRQPGTGEQDAKDDDT